jgi:hypothetical protein
MIGKSARSCLDPSAVVCLRNEKGGNNESGEKNKRAAHNTEQRPNERKQCHQKAGENIGFFSSIPMDRVGCGTCSYLRTRWRPNSALLPGGRESVTTVRNGRQAHKALRSHAQFCSPNTMSEASDRRHPVVCRCPKAPVGGVPEEAQGGFPDAPRQESRSFIRHLAPRHQVQKVMLVSGDREAEVWFRRGGANFSRHVRIALASRPG